MARAECERVLSPSAYHYQEDENIAGTMSAAATANGANNQFRLASVCQRRLRIDRLLSDSWFAGFQIDVADPREIATHFHLYPAGVTGHVSS